MKAPPKGLRQTEKQFMAAVVEYAKLQGFLCYHTFDARRSEPGFPDLCMTDGNRVVFAELKTEKGRLTAAQHEWAHFLELVSENPGGAVEYVLWTPKDWDDIEATLGKRVR